MGSDDKGKSVTETVAEEAKSVASEAYKDIGRPVLAPIGKTAGSAVELLLAPLNFGLDAIKTGVTRLKARVAKKLERIPPERQVAAPATMAPAALHYALLGDGDDVSELRELFENLLVTSMDRATVANAHPAFASMIAQMSPDEARILKTIDRRRYALVNLFDVSPEGNLLTQSAIGFRTLLGLGTGIDESRQQQCLSNLERLGILRIDYADAVAPDEERDQLERRVDAEFAERLVSGHAGSIAVTPLGWQFLETCVRVGV